MNATELTQLTFKTEPTQSEKLAELAHKHRRTVSAEIRMAVDAWIKRCEAEDGAES